MEMREDVTVNEADVEVTLLSTLPTADATLPTTLSMLDDTPTKLEVPDTIKTAQEEQPRSGSPSGLTIDPHATSSPALDSPTTLDLPNMTHLPTTPDSNTLDLPRTIDLSNAVDPPSSPTIHDSPTTQTANSTQPLDTIQLINITVSTPDSTCTASLQPTHNKDDNDNGHENKDEDDQHKLAVAVVTKNGNDTLTVDRPKPRQSLDKFIASVIKIQSVVRAWRAAKFMKIHVREHIFRTKAAFEILRIERSYVSDLRILIQQFCVPIKENSMLSVEEYTTLFSNVEAILPLHLKVLEHLDAKSNEWSFTQTISDVFSSARIRDFQEIYEVYINNYEKSFELLRTLKTSRNDFKTFLQATECTQKCRGLDLTSFLVQPIQRFPRYIVLLKELQRHTATAHPEMKHTSTALEGLHSLTLHLNEAKRKQVNRDMVKRVTHIVSGISDDFVAVDSQYLMEGVLKRVKGKIFKEKKSMYAFLFKDMLICAKQISDKNKSISMANYRFSFLERISLDNVRCIRNSLAHSDGFHVELLEPKKDYSFQAGTPEKRDVWMRALKENLRNVVTSSENTASSSSSVK